MIPRQADAVIIGAGVIGCSVAYHLARAKLPPVVLDATSLVRGASGACEGLLLLQSKKPGIHLDMAAAGIRRLEQLAEKLPVDIEYENKGGLVVIESEQELAAMRQFVAKQQKQGVRIELLNPAQAQELEPALSSQIVGATFSAKDGQVNPMHLTRGFLTAAKRAGTRYFPHTPVREIKTHGGRVSAVVTDQGNITTPLVVNATGARGAEIAGLAGLEMPIKPRRGQILITQPVPLTLKRCLLSAKYIAAKFNPQIAAAGGVGFAVEQTKSGNILIGSTREFVGHNRATTFEGLNSIAAAILKILPGIADLHVIRAFGGLRPYTPDGLPILGPVAGLEGFIMAAGHEGDGITLASITGEMIAQHITGQATTFPLASFAAERFSPANSQNT